MSISICLWTLLQRASMTSYNVLCDISILDCSSNSCMEVSEALGRRGASMDIAGLQRCGLKVFILSCRWQHIWTTAFDIANWSYLTVFISDGIVWHERVSSPGAFEITVSDVHVWKRVVLFIGSVWMSYPSDSSFYVIYFQNISSCNIMLLSLDGSSSLDVIDVLLVSDKLQRLWVQVSYTL